MPLPAGSDQLWPPKEWGDFVRSWNEWDAWYAGDPGRLLATFGSQETAPPVTRPSSWWQRLWWNNRNEALQHPEQIRRRRAHFHVPLPADISQTSAALLFGESPRITIPEAHVVANAPADAKASEEYLYRLIMEGDLLSRLMEGAEAASAMGGAILKPSWDLTVADVPLMTIVQQDSALPEFRYGRMVRCTLWRELGREGNNEVLRHLEVHETFGGRGVIYHGLYRGTNKTLGNPIALSNHADTAGLDPVVALPFDGLGVEYVPNMRPNRRKRGSSVGQSDYSGVEGLFDALDEVYASLMRDIRLAKGRLMVPEEYIDQLGVFDTEQEVFVPLNVDPTSRQGAGGGITATQFGIRVEQHLGTAMNLIERAVSAAGYSPQTFGLHIEGRAESGTALKIRENKTLTTQQRKAQWWGNAIESTLFKMMMIGRNTLASGVTAYRPQVEMTDSLPENPMELAQTISTLDNARAVSTETKVRMAHPEWDEEQIIPEVRRVLAEQGLVVPDPEEVSLPPLTPELTGQIGELYRAGFTGESILLALAAGDMTLLVQREGVQPVTLAAVEEEEEPEVPGEAPLLPPEAGAGFGG